MAKRLTRKETRGERNARWIEEHCVVPEGKKALIGKPVAIRPWQRDIMIKIYDNPAGTRQAILSFPRKNGKTAFIAFLLLLHLVGPEAVENSQLYSAAQSLDQAATVFKLASKTVRMSEALRPWVVIRDTIKQLFCPSLGTVYQALSADKSTAHGKSPIFAVHDELGQVDGPTSELYEAVETGMGAHDAPLSIVISTQAPKDTALLSRLIDDAATGRDPQTVLVLYSAPLEADPFAEETLKACNPAWGDFLNEKELLRTRDGAKALPDNEASYRNLHLNQRVDAKAPFVTTSVWKACAGTAHDLEDGLPVYAGLDLSAVADLTALVLVGKRDGVWHVRPWFWLPENGLREKALKDRASYTVWVEQGHLEACPGASIDYDWVAGRIVEVFERFNIERLAFDRWNMRHLKSALDRVGFDQALAEERLVEFGQGFASMSPALRSMEAELLNARIRHGDHPVLAMCAFNARATHDPAGNRKLDKAKSTGRIDGLVAMTMAFGVAPMDQQPQASVYEDRGLLMV